MRIEGYRLSVSNVIVGEFRGFGDALAEWIRRRGLPSAAITAWGFLPSEDDTKPGTYRTMRIEVER